jgi:hypothetical protein
VDDRERRSDTWQRPKATAMARYAIEQLGVDPLRIDVEPLARSTWDNVRQSLPLARAGGADWVAFVSHPFRVKRARNYLERQTPSLRPVLFEPAAFGRWTNSGSAVHAPALPGTTGSPSPLPTQRRERGPRHGSEFAAEWPSQLNRAWHVVGRERCLHRPHNSGTRRRVEPALPTSGRLWWRSGRCSSRTRCRRLVPTPRSTARCCR